MSTAILSTTFHQHQGADRVMWQLADMLSKQGDRVTLFTFNGTMEPPPNVPLVTMGMPTGFIGEKVFHLFFSLNAGKGIKYARLLRNFDTIYTGPYPASWLAYLAKRFYHKEYSYYFFHFNLPGFIAGLLARSYSRMHVFLEKWTLKRADKVITISEFSRRSLANLYDKDIKVVYCTVDCDRFKPGLDRTIIRNKYRLNDQPVILCVGQLIPSKGMHLLIEAFHRVKADLPDAQLIIAGKAVFPGYLKKLRDMAGGSVIFAHDVPEDELPYYYAACDVYATATLWEGFNIPLVEAQACGKPVVAFDIGPHPEVVENGVTGILVPPNDVAMLSAVLTELLQNKDTRQAMGKRGRIMVIKKFCDNATTGLSDILTQKKINPNLSQ
jgi:1,2-diacylglycerol 3-alpha-glucosyltransferase